MAVKQMVVELVASGEALASDMLGAVDRHDSEIALAKIEAVQAVLAHRPTDDIEPEMSQELEDIPNASEPMPSSARRVVARPSASSTCDGRSERRVIQPVHQR